MDSEEHAPFYVKGAVNQLITVSAFAHTAANLLVANAA